MKFLKAVASALSGTAKGAALAAEKYDANQAKITASVYSNLLANSDLLLAEQKKTQKDLDEQNKQIAAVQQLKKPRTGAEDGDTPPKNYTLPEATLVVQTANSLGQTPLEVLEKFKVTSEDAAKVIKIPGKSSGSSFNIIPKGKQDNSNFLFGESSAVENAEDMLKATGRTLNSTTPSITKVEGVTLESVVDEKDQGTNTFQFLVDTDGSMEQVIVNLTKDAKGTPVTTVYSMQDGKVVELTEGQQVVKDPSKLKKANQAAPFNARGPLVLVDSETGQYTLVKDKAGKTLFGYRSKKTGKILQADATGNYPGEDGIEVGGDVIIDTNYTATIAATKAQARLDQEKEAAKDAKALSLIEKVTKVTKSPVGEAFHVQYNKVEDIVENFNTILELNEQRVRILNKYPTVYSVATTVASAVTTVAQYSEAVQTIFNNFATLEETIKDADTDEIGNIRDDLRKSSARDGDALDGLINTLQQKLEGGTLENAEALTAAAVVEKALSIKLAYALAKSTGDTRISDQDFKAYFSTVSGKTVRESIALITSSLESSQAKYTNAIESLITERDTLYRFWSVTDFPEYDKAVNKWGDQYSLLQTDLESGDISKGLLDKLKQSPPTSEELAQAPLESFKFRSVSLNEKTLTPEMVFNFFGQPISIPVNRFVKFDPADKTFTYFDPNTSQPITEKQAQDLARKAIQSIQSKTQGGQ